MREQTFRWQCISCTWWSLNSCFFREEKKGARGGGGSLPLGDSPTLTLMWLSYPYFLIFYQRLIVRLITVVDPYPKVSSLSLEFDKKNSTGRDNLNILVFVLVARRYFCQYYSIQKNMTILNLFILSNFNPQQKVGKI